MDLTLLPSKKTLIRYELGVLVIAQGNSVIELTPEQAGEVCKFIIKNVKRPTMLSVAPQDLGN